MGLFSGSFGSGLVTGLATSVDKSLRDAMDKRDEEISRARQFWMTRQAQKMDLADEHDAQAEKLLTRMIDEMNGDVAKGLAAYKAAGGNNESVQSFFDSVDKTRQAGIDYNINEKLTLDGINLEDYADLTKEQAIGSIRMEVKPIDIQMQDMSGLANIGLGMKDLGKGVSENINQLIPARERTAIEGLTGAILDRTGTIENIQFKQDLMNAVPDLEKQISANLHQQNTGRDLMGNQLDEAALFELDKETASLVQQWSTLLKVKADAQSTGASLGDYSSFYKTRLVELEDEIGFKVTTEGMVIATGPNGETLMGDDALSYLRQRKDAMKAEFVGTMLIDSNGNYVNKDAQIFADGIGLGKYVDKAKATTAQEGDAVAAPDDSTTPPMVSAEEAGWGTTESIVGDSSGYVDWLIQSNSKLRSYEGLNKIADTLSQAGVDNDTIEQTLRPIYNEILAESEEADALAQADEERKANLPQFSKPEQEKTPMQTWEETIGYQGVGVEDPTQFQLGG